jgi:hypothetical protein
MTSMAGVSDIKMPLGIQKLGAPAASTAAVSPTHGPATDRPSRPTQATVPAPKMAMVRRRGVTPGWKPKKYTDGVSSNVVSGGWAALSCVVNGTRKNWWMVRPRALNPYQKAS